MATQTSSSIAAETELPKPKTYAEVLKQRARIQQPSQAPLRVHTQVRLRPPTNNRSTNRHPSRTRRKSAAFSRPPTGGSGRRHQSKQGQGQLQRSGQRGGGSKQPLQQNSNKTATATKVHNRGLSTSMKTPQQSTSASHPLSVSVNAKSGPPIIPKVPSHDSSQQKEEMGAEQPQNSAFHRAPQVQESGQKPPTSSTRKLDCDQSSTLIVHPPVPHTTPLLCKAPEYRKKYKQLLDLEEKEHSRILAESCDGEYSLESYDQEENSNAQFVSYACICGMRDYQIAYVTQAAETERKIGAKIYRKNSKIHCRAHILQRNYLHTEEKLYIAFDERGNKFYEHNFEPEIKRNHYINVDIKFELKRSYFRNLHRSVDNLPDNIIHRILPRDHRIFLPDSPTTLTGTKNELDTEQKAALNTILVPSCPNSPPILISGPFGTGKTRVMAIAAHMLFQRTHLTHILVCTQQRESADNFMLMYREVVSKSGTNDRSVKKIILRDYGRQLKILETFYLKPESLPSHLSAYKGKLLVVTTCLTAHYLAHENVEFTHIFVDEGAQMREPEAVAALTMANETTTLVIAGDPQQVGPAMLVFGKEAREGGLDKSLLERLVLEYKEMSPVTQNYHITLITNYRCHDDIRGLSGSLFYHDIPLKRPVKTSNQPRVFKLHESLSSIHFVCSSIMEDEMQNSATNEAEAMTVVEVLKEINREWPRYGIRAGRFERVCVMSKSRSQLRKIRSLIWKRDVSEELRRVRCIPTFAMQGNEYCVLILSTWEPLNSDGSPVIDSSKSLCNPHVFNTAITRSESLVVTVGNPVSLLKTEKHMIEDPNYREKGKCWSNYLRHCIENGTITFAKSMGRTREERDSYLAKVNQVVNDHLGRSIKYIPPDQRPNVISLENRFGAECKLGDGGYGLVLKVKLLTDKRTYAIKLKVYTKDVKRTEVEAEKLGDLKHDNIVRYCESGPARPPEWPEWNEWLENRSRFGQSSSSVNAAQIGGYSEPLCFFILTEWCDRGTLRDWLRSEEAKKYRSRSDIRDFLEQILQALKHIHERKLAHRDLKPSNIFLKSDDKGNRVVKVGDFGFVKDMEDHCASELTVTSPSEDNRSLSRNYGTEHYRSPELLNRRPKSEIDWKKVDIYALGVIFFELCWIIEDRDRYKMMTDLLPIEAKQKPKLPKKFAEEHCDEAADMILSMTSYDHTQRPSAESILEGKLASYTRKLKVQSRKKLSKQRKTKSNSTT